MTTDQIATLTTAIEGLLEEQRKQRLLLDRIANALEQGNGNPDLVYPLHKYTVNLDWNTVDHGIEEVARDPHGATILRYGGALYKRRAMKNEYGAVIMFSKARGGGASGKREYEALITFKHINGDVKPIPGEVIEAIKRERTTAEAR